MTNVMDELCQELDQWQAEGKIATLWWRDDDAVTASSQLKRLLDLAEGHAVPICLAVIPDLLQPDLPRQLAGYRNVAVFQHGISHRNNAPANRKKQELIHVAGVDLPVNDLANGIDRLRKAFPDRFCPVLVPPWNRIDPGLLPLLDDIGFCGLSCFQPRESARISDKVGQINTHVDIINWKQGRSFAGEITVVEQMTGHLQSRRLGEVDTAEPTGLLTHHLVHDAESWRFLDRLLDVLAQHSGVSWLSAERLFLDS